MQEVVHRREYIRIVRSSCYNEFTHAESVFYGFGHIVSGQIGDRYLWSSLLAKDFGHLFGGFAGAFDLSSPLTGMTLAMGAVNGFLYLAGFMLMQTNIRKNGVVLSATFMKLGLLVSILVSVLFFREIPSWTQGIGFAIAGHIPTGIALLGAAFVCAGLAIFLFFGCKIATKFAFRLPKQCLRLKKKEV